VTPGMVLISACTKLWTMLSGFVRYELLYGQHGFGLSIYPRSSAHLGVLVGDELEDTYVRGTSARYIGAKAATIPPDGLTLHLCISLAP
jgi:hypothetical protein